MKKFIVRFWLILITFTVGITSTIFWIRYNPRIESYDEVEFSEIPAVNYCDLVNDPQKYDGKIIHIKSVKLYWFMHGYFLANENCSGERDSARTAIDFYEQRQDIIWKKLEEIKGSKNYELAEIIAVGRFRYKTQIGNSDHIRDRTNLQFEIYDIGFYAY